MFSFLFKIIESVSSVLATVILLFDIFVLSFTFIIFLYNFFDFELNRCIFTLIAILPVANNEERNSHLHLVLDELKIVDK